MQKIDQNLTLQSKFPLIIMPTIFANDKQTLSTNITNQITSEKNCNLFVNNSNTAPYPNNTSAFLTISSTLIDNQINKNNNNHQLINWNQFDKNFKENDMKKIINELEYNESSQLLQNIFTNANLKQNNYEKTSSDSLQVIFFCKKFI